MDYKYAQGWEPPTVEKAGIIISLLFLCMIVYAGLGIVAIVVDSYWFKLGPAMAIWNVPIEWLMDLLYRIFG